MTDSSLPRTPGPIAATTGGLPAANAALALRGRRTRTAQPSPTPRQPAGLNAARQRDRVSSRSARIGEALRRGPGAALPCPRGLDLGDWTTGPLGSLDNLSVRQRTVHAAALEHSSGVADFRPDPLAPATIWASPGALPHRAGLPAFVRRGTAAFRNPCSVSLAQAHGSNHDVSVRQTE
jgi:hypothetical protein